MKTADLFFQHPHHVCQKWLHYFDIYDRYFNKFVGRPIKFLEIGVSQGGSLDIWKSYFGDKAEIIGADIDPACLRFEDPTTKIFIGDQSSPEFLDSLAQEIRSVDIILDDGGHRMDQQIITFEKLFPILSDGGIYMCEDTHTSYDPAHGGGPLNKNTFIEYMKAKIDELHEWYQGQHPQPHSLARNATSLCFHDSIVVVEKQRFDGPRYVEVGFNRR